MKMIIKDEGRSRRCIPCGILFRRDQEDKTRQHVERDHRIPYEPDLMGDVYDCGEIVTPEQLRAGGLA